jgi:hypothetical protein
MQNAIPLRRALIAVAAVAAFGIQIASAAAQTERDAQSTAQEAIRRLDLQTEVTREPEPFRIRLPTVVLAAADELAREGRYAEAMHVLLLRGLADIRARLDEPFADSLTSREILRSTRLPERARDSLRDVVGRVEWTYFGEYPAGQEDYAACRVSFNALEQALHGNAAA